jgi:acetolactate synthase-1/2/3 large subunit
MDFDDFGLDYGNPDFVKYIEAYGGKGHRIKAAKELLPLIQSCMAEPAVHLIDIAIDYSENDEILNNQLPILSAKV